MDNPPVSELRDRFDAVMSHSSLREMLVSPGGLVVALTFVGLVVRLFQVGVPPLLDGESIIGLAANSFAETGQNMLPAGHPYKRGELLTILSGMSMALFGKSAFALRLPMVLVGTLTIPLIYLLGRETFDTRVALVATALQTFALVNIAWSRTARFYTLLQLFILVGLLLYLRARSVVTVSYIARSVSVADRKRALAYVGSLMVVLVLGNQIHRGWILLPAIIGLHIVIPNRTEPVEVMRAKTLLSLFVLVNVCYVVFANDLLVPTQFLELVGLGNLETVSVWEHPQTQSSPVFFYLTYYPLLSAFAVLGSLVVLWRRGRAETLVFVGMYSSLFFFTYFGENFRFVWRPRYLLLTLPLFFLLAAAGSITLFEWLGARLDDLGLREYDIRDVSTRNVLLAVFAVLLITTPVSQGVQFTTDPYTLSRLEVPRTNYQGACEVMSGEVHSGDAVITNRPNQLYFWIEKVDYRGNARTAEWTAVPGRDHYTGAEIIHNVSEMKQTIRSHDRVWIVYNPFMNLVGEQWIRDHMTQRAVVDPAFEDRFPQGLYSEYLSKHENDERVYIYTKGIGSVEPEGTPVEGVC